MIEYARMARATKTTRKNKEVKLEDLLFNCRDHLRGRAPMTDKRDLMLTLVFLKFIGDRFLARRAQIIAMTGEAGAKNAADAAEDASRYRQVGVFYLTDECRWDKLIKQDPDKMAGAFDRALSLLEEHEEKLKNALPQQIFSSTQLDAAVLKAVVDDVNRIDASRFKDKDLIGRVYEYFLQAFSINADKEEGEFYTPQSIVELIAALVEPYDGVIYDPCCGSGGMFVQCAKFVEAHGGNSQTVTVLGQESEPSTFRLAKMNLAVRGISYNLGDKAASSFTDDQHKNESVDYVMANPPFNLKKYWAESLADDPRWAGYPLPPVGNANYAWILHILSKLKPGKGVAGFLLANGALGDEDGRAIRRKLIENDKVEAIIVLPRDMFYSTDISVTLWILNNNKKGGLYHGRKLRNREKEVLFIDLRTWNTNVYEKKYVKLTHEQIEDVCRIYFGWQTLTTGDRPVKYAAPELYASVGIAEIAANDWSLAPSEYIEFVDQDDALDYELMLGLVGTQVKTLLARQNENRKKLKAAFKALGVNV